MWSTDEGRALFLSAVTHRDGERVEQLLRDVKRIREDELEPWDLLIEQGSVEDVRWYLEWGFFSVRSISRHPQLQHTVMWAVFNAYFCDHKEEAGRTLVYLIGKGLDVNAHTVRHVPEWRAMCPLEVAVDRGWSYAVSVLLMAGARPPGGMQAWTQRGKLYAYGCRRARCKLALVKLLGIARWRARDSPLHKDCVQWVAREVWRRRYDAGWDLWQRK